MVTKDDIWKEIAIADEVIQSSKDPIVIAKASLKIQTLILKVSLNIRGNQVRIMKASGIPIESRREETTDTQK